ncbi:MAG: phage tail protein [Chloroflexi bacterium]|nr:phage tail protein [Chloroflexota bacterium]MBV9131637.1 phage tail protein [Chloroflexota bacterium]MBV9896826.1 phage tail protein [Chloroflexota bacterium]
MPDAMDPISAHQFALEIQGITEATFREASGFGSEHQIIEQKEQTSKGNTVIRKIPGTLKWQNITLKRGMTSNDEMWKWRQQVIDGKIEDARLDGSIVGYDENGEEKIRYDFRRGWPSKWESTAMNAGGNEPVVETIEITHEGLERKL